jgi:Tol biopolymer transport system component
MKKRRTLMTTVAVTAAAVAVVLAGSGSAGVSGVESGRIVFSGLDKTDGMSDIFVLKGDERTNITHDSDVRKDVTPAWSPDGNWVAFARHAQNGGASIMVVKANGKALTNLTPDAVDGISNVDPAWSPDGSALVFASNRDGNYELFTMKSNGGGLTQLTKTRAPVQNVEPDWSPAGQAIVFARSGRATTDASQLYVMKNAAGAFAQQVTKTHEGFGDRAPAWSPNGRTIAFHSDRAGNNDVYVVNWNGKGLQRLTSSPKTDVEPTWAANGTALIFVSSRTGPTEFFAIDLAGAAPGPQDVTQLTFDGQQKSAPDWAPPQASDVEPVPQPVPPVDTDPIVPDPIEPAVLSSKK